MPDVFVSYRHVDVDLVAPIADGLARRGLEVWFDRTDIQSGERWRERIAEGIGESGAVVVAVGPAGIGGVQAFEVGLALDRAVLDLDFPIIPLLLPEAKREGREWSQLASRSFVELDGAPTDDVVDRIADAVRGLGAPSSHDAPAVGDETEREPYPGLRSFTVEEADLYFGREADIAALVDLSHQPGLVAVIGPSGSGKSSLVIAGLVPRLEHPPGAPTTSWQPIILQPGRDPLRTFLAALVAAHDPNPLLPAGVIEQGLEDPGTFSTAVLIALERIDRRLGLLIVVDQLEELFTMCDADEERRAFADNLAQLGERCPPRAKVVVTLRSDYLDELSQHPRFARLIGARHHLLAPLDEDGLREVIQRPAWRCGVSLEPKLVEEILLDVENQPNPLPLLSVALHEMWRHRQGDRLTLKAYAEGGRVTGTLADMAEGAVSPFLPRHEALVRATLLRLVFFAPGAPATRRRRGLDELVVGDVDKPIVVDLVAALAQARLLVSDEDAVEFSHDAVITAWPRLRDWVAAARGDEEIRQRIEAATTEWLDSGRSPDYLATAGMAAEAGPLLHTGRLLLGTREHEFLAASERTLRRGRRRRWLAVGAAAVAAVAIVGVGLLWRRNSQQEAENTASSALRLAELALRAGSDRPDLGLQLAATAFGQADRPAVRSALATALSQPAPLVGQWALRPTQEVTAAALVPGQDRLLAGTADGDLLNCEVTSRSCAPWQQPPKSGSVRSISAAENTVAVILGDGSVVAGGLDGPLRELPTGGEARVASLAPNGGLVAVGTSDGAIEVRNLAGSGGPVGRVAGIPSAVAVGSGLDVVLGAGSDRAGFTLWDIGGRPLADISSAEVIGAVQAAVIDTPSDRVIVSAGSGGDILIWSLDALRAGDPGVPQRLAGHERPVVGLTVEGDRLVSVDASGVIRQWDLRTLRPVGAAMKASSPLGQPAARMVTAGYDDEGRRVIGVRSDAVLEWDAQGHAAFLRTSVGLEDLVAIAATAADDELYAVTAASDVVTIGPNGASSPVPANAVSQPTAAEVLGPGELVIGGRGLTIVDPRTGVSRAQRDDLDVTAIATSADAGRVAVATADGRVMILAAADLANVAGPYAVGDTPVTDLALSADGAHLAVGREGEQDVVVIDAGTGEVTPLRGHTAEVTAVAFSGDGRLLASGSDDRNIIVWSTGDWQPTAVLTGHDDLVRRLAFAADGELLVSGSDDGTMRWWNVSDQTPLGLPIRWDGRRVDDVEAGATIAASRHGSTLAIWDTTPAAWVRLACAIAPRELTEAERTAYLGDRQVTPPCP